MNVFRSRKKSVSDGSDVVRPNLDPAPPLPKSGRSIFSRKKQQQEEPAKKEVNLTEVLPSKDDFRTSLLMPNLAQRFSMLREQDDPHSKIGKASDDSVLSPRRASRLDLFGPGSLDDIAEVSSIAGSFRPPFAQEGRANSYMSDGLDGYASDTGSASGSIMGRSRPGQGNKLFGGRQKVYIISGGTGRATNKAVYDDDVNTSVWQKLRKEGMSPRSFDFDPNDRSLDGSLSPAMGSYNRNRETSSSTNSNEPTSTAATSMTSIHDSSSMMTKEQARDRPLNKRLYGQNIDQQVHEQQNSAMARLNSVRNGRGFGKIGTRPGPASGASSLRSGSSSPALNTSTGFDFGLAVEKGIQLGTRDVDSGYHGPSTMPSPISPQQLADPTLAAHLDPNDLGKATAIGTFNKPNARYDDQQFAQRQLQLREDRETSRAPSSGSETPSDWASNRRRQGSDASIGRASSTQNFSRMHSNRSVSRDGGSRQVSGQSRNERYEASDSEDSYSTHSSHLHGVGANNSHIQPVDEQQHPALRAPITEEDEADNEFSGKLGAGFDSPVLGATHLGVGDMVRGHLRHRSDTSSVYSDSVATASVRYSTQNITTDSISEEPPYMNSQRPAGHSELHDGRGLMPGSALNLQGPLLSPSYANDSAGHTRSPSNDTLLERDAFADELAERRRQVEEKLRKIAESRANFDGGRDESPHKSLGILKKSASKSSLAKKFISGSGTATPTGEEEMPEMSPRRHPGNRKTSDPRRPDPSLVDNRSGPRSPMRDRDIGAERRARYAALRSPTGGTSAALRGQVEARKQQFAGGAGTMPRDFTERVVANPDQGKPHFHPAGRARHYSPPRASTTPDQKPQLPAQSVQTSRPGTARSASKSRFTSDHSDFDSPHMVSPGPDRANATTPIQYASARKRSVSKADISSPVNLVSSTYALSTVPLSPDASLENGMDEIRAADSAHAPPVPPINPRRRAMGAFRKVTRSNTGSPDSEDEGSRSPKPAIRKQMSEGSNLRERIRERIALPGSPSPTRGLVKDV